MTAKILYFVVHPDRFTRRYGMVGTLDLWQDNNMAQLDSVFNDCIQIYPRAGQPDDPDKVVVAARFGRKMQEFLADQCGVIDPFTDPDAVMILDVYNQVFLRLETLKAEHTDLDGTIQIEYLDENGETQTRELPIINESLVWAGD